MGTIVKKPKMCVDFLFVDFELAMMPKQNKELTSSMAKEAASLAPRSRVKSSSLTTSSHPVKPSARLSRS